MHFQVEVAKAVPAAFQPQTPLSTGLSDVGTLHLVFDASLLAKALASPRRAANGSSGAEAAAEAAAERLQAALVERLDPVDWAAYREPMAGLVVESLSRKGLLLGLLLRGTPVDGQVWSACNTCLLLCSAWWVCWARCGRCVCDLLFSVFCCACCVRCKLLTPWPYKRVC